jgi:hypothetical protein
LCQNELADILVLTQPPIRIPSFQTEPEYRVNVKT